MVRVDLLYRKNTAITIIGSSPQKGYCGFDIIFKIIKVHTASKTRILPQTLPLLKKKPEFHRIARSPLQVPSEHVTLWDTLFLDKGTLLAVVVLC